MRLFHWTYLRLRHGRARPGHPRLPWQGAELRSWMCGSPPGTSSRRMTEALALNPLFLSLVVPLGLQGSAR